MATITPTIQQNNQRKDGRWLVVYRITHKRKSVFIKTSILISENQLNKDRTIKQKFILSHLSRDINDMNEKIMRLGLKVEVYSASQLKEILTSKGEFIDFIKFCEESIEELRNKLKPNTIGSYITTVNHLRDHFKDVRLNASEITSKHIISFMEYLKQPKEIIRNVGANKRQETIFKTKATSGNTLNTIYFRLSKLFDLCKDKYNDEELNIIRIPNDPFSRVAVPKLEATKKRSISVVDIRKLLNYQPMGWSEMVGKNMFMLSFYLCGINIVDIRNNIHNATDRLNYNRSKIEDKRSDKGFISIRIHPEAIPYVNWYKSISHKWSNTKNLIATTNKGMRSIAKKIGIDESISSYYARHSFATIARNDCGISKDNIAMALNHVDNSTKITDIYIKPDWTIIDTVQEAVINKINDL